METKDGMPNNANVREWLDLYAKWLEENHPDADIERVKTVGKDILDAFEIAFNEKLYVNFSALAVAAAVDGPCSYNKVLQNARESKEETDFYTFAELRNTGVLWAINKYFFHPHGWALALHMDGKSDILGWTMLGDGSEPWSFESDEPEKTDYEAFMKNRRFDAVTNHNV